MKRLCGCLLWFFSVCAHAGTKDLVVHEWGTFTSLQDESGRAIGGINSDDEPVPKFVHDLNRLLVLKPSGDSGKVILSTPAAFANEEFSAPNLAKLRAQMRRSLVEEGLFNDEAEALLNTWELSYFKSAGLRLFFLVPRDWTERYLPLELSVPAKVSRVLVGRIELVTPGLRQLLRQIADAPIPTKPWACLTNNGANWEYRGAMPPTYRDLGRFRNGLVLDELKQHPTESLRAFIEINGLQACAR